MYRQLVEKALNNVRHGVDMFEKKAVYYLVQQIKNLPRDKQLEAIKLWCDNIGEAYDGVEDRSDFCLDIEDVTDIVDEMLEKGVALNRDELFDMVKEKALTSKNDPSWPEYSESSLYLLRVCRELQEYRGKNDFILSQADAGEIIGRSQVAGGSRLAKFVKDGVLERILKGFTGRSSIYRFKDTL